ncbi:MAG: carboxymuconolactone decarboxylase [Rhodospirillaceae bacterium]|nr:MAG: carboxymuconolactone decarboxylase [Rhodospirillaceae bacterium]
MTYPVHSLDTAPAAAKEDLAEAKAAYGFLPNLLGVMAEAPALLKAYRTVAGLFEGTSLSSTEQQIVLLAVSHENKCNYCVAAHSVIAKMQKVPVDVVHAVRDGQPVADKKLEALRRFTGSVVASRGWPSDADTKAFLDAGYSKAQILEVVLGIGMKTLSNYTNHIADTPLDEAFAGEV